jgi:hypothetical protein
LFLLGRRVRCDATRRLQDCRIAQSGMECVASTDLNPKRGAV